MSGCSGGEGFHFQRCTRLLLVEMRTREKEEEEEKNDPPTWPGGWGPRKVEQKGKVGLTTSQAESRCLLFVYSSSHAKDNNHIPAQRGFNSAPILE